MSKKWLYLFNEVDQAENHVGGNWDDVRGLLGGKGANLAEMVRIDVPVPPGFTITSEACNEYIKLGEIFPKDMWEQVQKALNVIESETGKNFGGKKKSLACFLPFRRQVFNAWHDGYGIKHWIK
jgi:pyruvate,orthophosphate dikinase